MSKCRTVSIGDKANYNSLLLNSTADYHGKRLKLSLISVCPVGTVG